MEASDKTFADVVKLLTSWLPRRSKPDNVSRDFWMPDHSCRVCYDCDTQFTIFNRRHHCRRCGRIFCGKCTAKSVPVRSGPDKSVYEADKIRVCNFCFKQWEQEQTNVFKQMQPVLSPSLSEASLFSTKSTITVNSVSTPAGCYSTGKYQHNMARASNICPPKISQDKASHSTESTHVPEKNMQLFQTEMTLLRFNLTITETGVTTKMKSILTSLTGRYNINNTITSTSTQMSLMSLMHPIIQRYQGLLKKM